MLSIYDNGQKCPITDMKNFSITHIDGGFDTLEFDLQPDSETYTHVAEENRVEYRDNGYLVKYIDQPGSWVTIDCEVDLDFLKENFHKAYDSGSVTLSALLSSLLPGWTVSGYDPEIRRTIHLENATDYDVIKQALSTYSVAFEWHTVKKSVVVLNPNNTTPSGEYLTDELNLRGLGFKGKTDEFITRLYPYGKGGMTIADVNDGKEYVENHQYSDKVVCGYWSDERYTVPESLKADAIARLASLSAPVRSYECDVIDLQKLDGVKYKDFEFSMYKVVTLIDRRRKVRLDHQIMEYKEYPKEPQRNVLTLSSVVPTVQHNISVVQETAETAQKSANEANAGVEEAKTEITQLNGQITLKADKGSLIAEINVSPEQIKIAAEKLELSGLVKISNLENGETEIDGACIRTGRIESEDGSWWLDLEEGKFYLSSGTFAGEAEWKDDDGDVIGSITCGGQAGLIVGGNKVSIESPDLSLNAQESSAVYAKSLEIGNRLTIPGGSIYANGERGITDDIPVMHWGGEKTRYLEIQDGIIVGVHDD
ncbi:MAG: phage tail protein [Oscillospiraceae bacterium]|jgi:phage minor structural protein|nr:phage tail protein [Oscillospiraceae bacterium]